MTQKRQQYHFLDHSAAPVLAFPPARQRQLVEDAANEIFRAASKADAKVLWRLRVDNVGNQLLAAGVERSSVVRALVEFRAAVDFELLKRMGTYRGEDGHERYS